MYFSININHIGLFTDVAFRIVNTVTAKRGFIQCMRSNCAYDPMDDGEVTARQID